MVHMRGASFYLPCIEGPGLLIHGPSNLSLLKVLRVKVIWISCDCLGFQFTSEQGLAQILLCV
jgi:hypothetical protein